MKRKRNPERADRDNPVWTKETFARARKAREVLPEFLAKQLRRECSSPVVGRSPAMHVRLFLCVSLRILWRAGRLRARLADPHGRGAKEGGLTP